MTDVSLCSCSPSSKIINGNPVTGKTLLCCREILPYIFPFYCSRECRQISSRRPFVTSFSSSRVKGMQNPKYIWVQQFLRKKMWVQFFWPRQEIIPLSAIKCWDAVLQTWGPSFGMQQLFQISRYPPKPETLKSPSSFHKIGCCSTVHMYELRVKLGCDMWREWDEVMNEINLTLL